MDLGEPGQWQTDAIGEAKERGMTEVATLLERFQENQVETRYQVRLELGLVDEMAAEMFAMVVFVSDELLQVTREMDPKLVQLPGSLPSPANYHWNFKRCCATE